MGNVLLTIKTILPPGQEAEIMQKMTDLVDRLPGTLVDSKVVPADPSETKFRVEITETPIKEA